MSIGLFCFVHRSLLLTNVLCRYLGTECPEDCSRLYIFLEFVSGGSVADMLSNFGALHESIVRKYTHQMLLGLVFLHSNNVVCATRI